MLIIATIKRIQKKIRSYGSATSNFKVFSRLVNQSLIYNYFMTYKLGGLHKNRKIVKNQWKTEKHYIRLN